MRVLFATYPWAFETPGGGEMQVLKYEQYLKAAGYDIVRHDAWNASLAGIDVVHFFSCMGGSIHFCNYAKSRGLPLVVSSSLWITEETAQLYPIGEIAAQLSLADAIVTNSEMESDQLSAVLALDRGKFHAIYNACDPEFAIPVEVNLFRRRFEITGPFLLNVGNVEPRKNQLGLIRAAKTVGIPLVMIGHVRSSDYAAACWAEGGGMVTYLGPMEHGDPILRSAYAACSAFCLPSTLETPGLAALEAAAAGAPLVITAEGSTYEYFGDDAFYVENSEDADLVKAIKAALSAQNSSRLRLRMVERFTWDRAVAPLASLYSVVADAAHMIRTGDTNGA